MTALPLLFALSLLLAVAGWLWTSPRSEHDATLGGLLIALMAGLATGAMLAGLLGWLD